MYGNVARLFNGLASFGVISSPELATHAKMVKEEGGGAPLAQFRGESGTRWDYHGEWDVDNIAAWLHHNMSPLVHVISTENYARVVGSTLPTAILFVADQEGERDYNTLDQREDVNRLIGRTAARLSKPAGWVGGYTGPLVFSVVLASEYAGFAANLGLSLASRPELVRVRVSVGLASRPELVRVRVSGVLASRPELVYISEPGP